MIYVINQYGTGSGGIYIPVPLAGTALRSKYHCMQTLLLPSKPLQTVVGGIPVLDTQQAVSPD